jgi:hypothetical protein
MSEYTMIGSKEINGGYATPIAREACINCCAGMSAAHDATMTPVQNTMGFRNSEKHCR